MAFSNANLSRGMAMLLHRLTRTDPIISADVCNNDRNFTQFIRIRFVILEKEYRYRYEVGRSLIRDSQIGESRMLESIYKEFIEIIQQKSNEVYENEEQDDSGNDGSDDWATHINGMRVYGRQVISHANSVT